MAAASTDASIFLGHISASVIGVTGYIQIEKIAWVSHHLWNGKSFKFFYRSRQPFFPVATMLWVISFCETFVGHYAPEYSRARRNTPSSFGVNRQQGNHSNNRLSRHHGGTLTSHWRPLFLWTTVQTFCNINGVILSPLAVIVHFELTIRTITLKSSKGGCRGIWGNTFKKCLLNRACMLAHHIFITNILTSTRTWRM